MTDATPAIELVGVRKRLAGPRPLTLGALRLRAGERLAISGVEPVAAEMIVHLITGAALPDEGDVRVFGRSTRDIATDTEWLASLDRLGIVTARAVLLEGLPLASNLALPFTLSIDPMPADVRRRVERLAEEVELAGARLATPAGELSAEERVRTHLARALAPEPAVLLLEHPTQGLATEVGRRIGATLGRLSAARGLAWIAFTEDAAFAKAAGARHVAVDHDRGKLVARRWWQRVRG